MSCVGVAFYSDLIQRCLSSNPLLDAELDDASALTKEDDLKCRLESYTFSRWGFKPQELSSLRCAIAGWTCVDKNLLQCLNCKCYLAAALPLSYAVEIYKVCVDRVVEGLISAHKTTCLWRSYASPAKLYAPDVFDVSASLSRLNSSFNGILSSNEFLQIANELKADSLVNMGISENSVRTVGDILRETSASSARDGTSDTVNKLALLLSLLGWAPQKGSEQVALVCCKFCLRHLPLWLFLNADASDDYNAPFAFDSQPKRLKTAVKVRPLNPVREHERWCPWLEHVEVPITLRLFCEDSGLVAQISPSDSGGADNNHLPETLPRWKVLLLQLLRKSITKSSGSAATITEEMPQDPIEWRSMGSSRDAYMYARQVMNDNIGLNISAAASGNNDNDMQRASTVVTTGSITTPVQIPASNELILLPMEAVLSLPSTVQQVAASAESRSLMEEVLALSSASDALAASPSVSLVPVVVADFPAAEDDGCMISSDQKPGNDASEAGFSGFGCPETGCSSGSSVIAPEFLATETPSSSTSSATAHNTSSSSICPVSSTTEAEFSNQSSNDGASNSFVVSSSEALLAEADCQQLD